MCAKIQRGMNHQHQKQFNRGLIFQLLATNPDITRAELASKSGLTPMTLSNIVNEFISKGCVEVSTESTRSSVPANASMLRISPSAPKVLGCLITREHIAAALCDLRLNVIETRYKRIDTLDEFTMIDTLFGFTDELIRDQNVLGIGIGSIGPVAIDNGVILNPTHFYGIHDVPIVKYFKQRYRLPVYLNHHFNCIALAENYYGNGQKYHDFIFMNIDEGINPSIVTGNELYSDNTGYSSEFGLSDFDESALFGTKRNPGQPAGLVQMDFSSPQSAHRTIQTFTSILVMLCNLLNPQAIIIGDENGFISANHYLEIEREINERIVIKNYRHIDVCHAYRKEDLEVSSCAISVIQDVFRGNLLL